VIYCKAVGNLPVNISFATTGYVRNKFNMTYYEYVEGIMMVYRRDATRESVPHWCDSGKLPVKIIFG
jgi:hypothetical protein